MKTIGIFIGSERVPISKKYYQKYRKIMDQTCDELDVDEITYDIAIYALTKHYSPKDVNVVPLWKLEYTKQELDECDIVYCIYEFTYAIRDYGMDGYKKYMKDIKRDNVYPSYELQNFVKSKQRYMNYLKKKGFPIMDTIFYQLKNKTMKDCKELEKKIEKRFEGQPIYCKPELGGFAEGSKLFKTVTAKSLHKYIHTLAKGGYQKLLIQPYLEEFTKFWEYKMIFIQGKFSYCYGANVRGDVGEAVQSELDQPLLRKLKKMGKEIVECISKDFGVPFLLRVDFGCCLQNDSVCRDYFLNEIECCPAMDDKECEKGDNYLKQAKLLGKI